MQHLTEQRFSQRLHTRLPKQCPGIAWDCKSCHLHFPRQEVASMRRKIGSKKPNRHKTKLGLPDLEHVKSAVLVSLLSPESERMYRCYIEALVSWHCSELPLSFIKSVRTR